jgi:hypothetical protein
MTNLPYTLPITDAPVAYKSAVDLLQVNESKLNALKLELFVSGDCTLSLAVRSWLSFNECPAKAESQAKQSKRRIGP